MKIEIERKYLLNGDDWRQGAVGTLYRQGYLCTDPERTVRVRIGGDRAILAIKGGGDGLARAEFEYPIPPAEAEALLAELCLQPLVEKYRYLVPFAGLTWEVDEFLGRNAGLLLAEIELERIDQAVELPPWVGIEVTGDPRYYNAWLTHHPFSTWPGWKELSMKTRRKFLDYAYEEVLDTRTRELIRVGCAVAVGCPDWLHKHLAVARQAGASDAELKEAMAYGMIAPAGRAKNFVKGLLPELGLDPED